MRKCGKNHIRPLREAGIEKCKEDKTKAADWCERYYKDYGNATRGPEGNYTPRMFNDLAPCVQAREMKAKTREATVPATKRGETTTDLDKTIKKPTSPPEEVAETVKSKQTDTVRESTLETKKRDTEKAESTRDSSLQNSQRDSTSGKSDR